MRLILLNHELSPIGGGAGHATRQIASELANRGHEITIVTAFAKETAPLPGSSRVVVQALLQRRRSSNDPLTLKEHLAFHVAVRRKLCRIALSSSAEGILAFFALPNGVSAIPTTKKLGIPLGITLRGSDVPGFAGGRLSHWQQRLLYRPLKKSLNHSSFVTANGHGLQSLMTRLWPEFSDRIGVVENGIHDSDIAAIPASSAGPSLHLIAVSRLIPRKRVDLILRALADCPNPRPQLTVVGDGPESSKLKLLTEALGLKSQVTFLGQLDRPKINSLLRQSDIFVTASRAEGTSNSLLDAIAAGLPIITTRNGSDHTVASMNCGYIVPGGKANEICRAIIKLHCPQVRAEFAWAGLNAIKKATWAENAKSFESHFRNATRVATAAMPATPGSGRCNIAKKSTDHSPSHILQKGTRQFSSPTTSVLTGER